MSLNCIPLGYCHKTTLPLQPGILLSIHLNRMMLISLNLVKVSPRKFTNSNCLPVFISHKILFKSPVTSNLLPSLENSISLIAYELPVKVRNKFFSVTCHSWTVLYKLTARKSPWAMVSLFANPVSKVLIRFCFDTSEFVYSAADYPPITAARFLPFGENATLLMSAWSPNVVIKLRFFQSQ